MKPPPQPLTIDNLLNMNRAQLDQLFRNSEPGPIPDGNSTGDAIVDPGGWWNRLLMRLIYKVAWQGKVFKQYKCPKCGDLVLTTLENKIGPEGMQTIEARVYYAPSWLDGKQSIVLDYSKTSFLAQKIRDEIRLVGDKLYLGKVWWGKTQSVHFALQF